MEKVKRDWPVLITCCVAIGGIAMAVFMCLLVGFGLNTTVGKEAIYVAFALQTVNVGFLHKREQQQKGTDAPNLRRLRAVAAWLWRGGAVLLLTALVLGLCGVSYGNFWVRYPCLIGTVLLPVAWVGILCAYHGRNR